MACPPGQVSLELRQVTACPRDRCINFTLGLTGSCVVRARENLVVTR
jgi:hypothetical protein